MRFHLVGILLFFIFFATAAPFPGPACADRCLVVYPQVTTYYHYDVNEYFTVSAGHPLYDPIYDRGGQVLIDINDLQVALDIYQATNLVGFQPSVDGEEGYFSIGRAFNLIVDGFSNSPTTYVNIILVFEGDPADCAPRILVNGENISGGTKHVGNLTVSTPTAEGNNYSDVRSFYIQWFGCPGLRIWAYADENFNGLLDGSECFTAFSHDVTLPTQETSWGAIKAIYRE